MSGPRYHSKAQTRVLHVLQSLERSGMEMMLLSSATEWRARGFVLDLLATAPDAGPLAADLATAGYRIFHVPFRSRLRYLPRLRLFPEFRRICREGRYDIVHVHTEAASTLYAALARSAGVARIVFSVHNTFRFRGLLRARKSIERSINRCLGGRYGMVSDAVMACEWERFRNRGIRISNWLDSARFRPPSNTERQMARHRLGCPDDAFVLCTVGNCDPAKNHPELLQALVRVRQEVRVLLLHVGREQPGEPERSLAATLELVPNVRFEGSQTEPLFYLWAADAFVMPSRHEGLCIAALEAVAAGAPAILARASGLDEIAAGTTSTTRCNPDAVSIAEAILTVARMPRAERLAGARADSERIRQDFSVGSGVDCLIDRLYRGAGAAAAAG